MEAEQSRDQLHQELLHALGRIEASEQRLVEKNRELQGRNRDLLEFSASVTHELRTPIMSLKGFSEIMQKEYGSTLDERGRHFIERIHHNAVRMSQIVQGIQEIVLVGVTSEKKAWSDPNSLASGFLRDCREQLDEQQVNLVIQPDMPMVWTEPSKFQQVLVNLLGNAVKFAGGDGQGRVELGFVGPLDGGHFYCQDSGPGVAPEDRQRIFELFYRADKERPGAGIGLAVVRRVLDLCKGEIWVEEAEGGGARFCFRMGEKLRAKEADDP
jgi:signal transduction histidine kinase